jgi:hypothetical protein
MINGASGWVVVTSAASIEKTIEGNENAKQTRALSQLPRERAFSAARVVG